MATSPPVKRANMHLELMKHSSTYNPVMKALAVTAVFALAVIAFVVWYYSA